MLSINPHLSVLILKRQWDQQRSWCNGLSITWYVVKCMLPLEHCTCSWVVLKTQRHKHAYNHSIFLPPGVGSYTTHCQSAYGRILELEILLRVHQIGIDKRDCCCHNCQPTVQQSRFCGVLFTYLSQLAGLRRTNFPKTRYYPVGFVMADCRVTKPFSQELRVLKTPTVLMSYLVKMMQLIHMLTVLISQYNLSAQIKWNIINLKLLTQMLNVCIVLTLR